MNFKAIAGFFAICTGIVAAEVKTNEQLIVELSDAIKSNNEKALEFELMVLEEQAPDCSAMLIMLYLELKSAEPVSERIMRITADVCDAKYETILTFHDSQS